MPTQMKLENCEGVRFIQVVDALTIAACHIIACTHNYNLYEIMADGTEYLVRRKRVTP